MPHLPSCALPERRTLSALSVLLADPLMRRNASVEALVHVAGCLVPSWARHRRVLHWLARAIVLAGAVMTLATSARAQALPSDDSAFQVGRRWPLIGTPSTLAVADLDDDGLPDVMVAESYPNRVTIWWNDGSGGLEPTPTVVSETPAFAIVAIDADGDGRPDVVWTDSLGLHRALVRPGRQVGAPELIVAAPDLGPLVAGDLDRNGRDDLVLGQGSNVSWMRNGSAGLVQPTLLDSTASIVTALAASPNELPGDREIAVGHKADYDEPQPGIDVLHIDPHGQLRSVVQAPLPDGFGSVWNLVLADLDDDGAPDLILGSGVILWGGDFGQQRAVTSAPDGGVSLRPAAVTPDPWEGVSTTAVGDLDGDGRLDLVVEDSYSGGGFYGPPVHAVFGLGGRTFMPRADYLTDPEDRAHSIYRGLVLADMDGDGRPDVVTLDRPDYYPTHGWIEVALRTGRELGLERVDTLGEAGGYRAYGGSLHVIHGSAGGRDELMQSGPGGTRFMHLDDSGHLVIESRPDLPGPFVFADVDGDGHEDAIEVRDSVSVVHFGTRFNTYAAVETVSVPHLRCGAHLEHDRRMALVGLDASGEIVIAERQRSGQYAYETIPPTRLTFEYELDGRSDHMGLAAIPRERGRPDDLVLCARTWIPARFGPPPTYLELLLLRRDRRGDWQEIQHFSPPADISPFSVPAVQPFIVADVNGDGRPDVLLLETADSFGGTVHVYLSSTDGTLTPVEGGYAGSYEWPNYFAVADFDHDGRLDIAIGATWEGNIPWVAVYFGDGQGRFDREAWFFLGTGFGDVVFVAVADLDGDGIPDLTAISEGEHNALTTIFGAGPALAMHRRHSPRAAPIVTPAPLAIVAVSPMPARDAFDVRFTAPTQEPTRFELLDVAGRRVSEREVVGTGPAHFEVGHDIHPGVYWLRATQGTRSATARVVVLR